MTQRNNESRGEYLERRKINRRSVFAARRSLGLCDCGKTAEVGLKSCSKCRDRSRCAQANEDARRRLVGLCLNCGHDRDGVQLNCTKCRAAQKKSRDRNYTEAKRTYFREWARKKISSDPIFNLKKNLRRSLWGYLKKREKLSLCNALGCSGEWLLLHLEEQMSAGMNWNNYGEWHVDHIQPLASFDLTDPEQQRAAWHYTNLQPLWGRDNQSKGARWAV